MSGRSQRPSLSTAAYAGENSAHNVSSATTAPDINIVSDQVSIHPAGYTEAPGPINRQPGSQQEQNLVAHMARFRQDPFAFLKEISLHVQGSGWRSYDKIIGQPIFYPGFSENIKAAVMETPMLQSKIAELATRRLNEEIEMGLLGGHDDEKKRSARKTELIGALQDVAEKMTDNMICKMDSKPFIRSAYYMVTSLLTRAYHQGIHVSSEEVLRLYDVAQEAARKRQAIIFLPNHRSHIDYVSLQLICYRLGLALPTVVAGDNLNIPLLGPFLQHAGAMWIRRSFGDDQLYVTLLQAYIDTLLQKGFNFECFIEGGRSRMGKLLPPKFGILSFVLDSVLSGRVKDAIICPVSTQYDKVIEVDSYISELLGTPKQKENLMDFLSASSVLSLKLGRVDVRFHQPWSLVDFIQTQQQRYEKLSSKQQADLNKAYNSNLRIRLLRTLGYKVLADINAVAVIMPTSLIGTVLLTLRGRGVGKAELIRRVDALSERVKAAGGRVAHFAGQPTATVVERGLEVLGPQLVGVEGTRKGLAEDTFYAVDRFQLSFYRNMTIHLFVSEALVCVALYTRLKVGDAPMPYSDLLARVAFLSQLFRGEFIFATEGLSANLAHTLETLAQQQVVALSPSRNNATNTAALAEHLKASDGQKQQPQDPSDIEAVTLHPTERADGRHNFDFYCFLIWPFVEAAWLGALSLLMLTPPASSKSSSTANENTTYLYADAKRFSALAQSLGKTLYAQGDLSYFEAVNAETLRNCFARAEADGILVSRQPAAPSPPTQATASPASATTTSPQRPAPPTTLFALSPDWRPTRSGSGHLQASGRLWDWTEEISRARLEGKNRRDGTAVVRRMLGLVESCSARLWGEGGWAVDASGQRMEGWARL